MRHERHKVRARQMSVFAWKPRCCVHPGTARTPCITSRSAPLPLGTPLRGLHLAIKPSSTSDERLEFPPSCRSRMDAAGPRPFGFAKIKQKNAKDKKKPNFPQAQ